MKSDEALLHDQIEYYRARAPEYAEWFDRKGRYDKGSDHSARWAREVNQVRRELTTLGLRGSVLELACGTGIWTAELAKQDVAITAVDSSPEALAINRERLEGHPVRYIEADLFELESRERFDAVVFTFWLSHVPPDRFDWFWSFVDRSLAPDGQVFFVDNRWYPEYRWPHGADHGPPSAAGPDWVVPRQLNDGRRFEIVKVFYQAAELSARLEQLGWRGRVQETPEFFLWGSLQRAETAGRRADGSGSGEPAP